jgi:hypothetical protein
MVNAGTQNTLCDILGNGSPPFKRPDALSSRLRSLQTFVDTSWKDATANERSTLPAPPAPNLRYPIGTTICNTSRAYGEVAHAAVYLSLLIVFPTCLQHHLRVFLPSYSGNFYPKRISPSWGAPAPFHYPPPHLKRPRLRSTKLRVKRKKGGRQEKKKIF